MWGLVIEAQLDETWVGVGAAAMGGALVAVDPLRGARAAARAAVSVSPTPRLVYDVQDDTGLPDCRR